MVVAWVRRIRRQSVCRCVGAGRVGSCGAGGSAGLSRADAVAEFEQFALHSAVASARILRRHPYGQRGEVGIDRWRSGWVRVGPLLAHESTVPAQDGVRDENAVGAWAAAGRGRRTTARSARSRHGLGLAAWHRDLVPQHERLGSARTWWPRYSKLWSTADSLGLYRVQQPAEPIAADDGILNREETRPLSHPSLLDLPLRRRADQTGTTAVDDHAPGLRLRCARSCGCSTPRTRVFPVDRRPGPVRRRGRVVISRSSTSQIGEAT
jgi:hypothetical protein